MIVWWTHCWREGLLTQPKPRYVKTGPVPFTPDIMNFMRQLFVSKVIKLSASLLYGNVILEALKTRKYNYILSPLHKISLF